MLYSNKLNIFLSICVYFAIAYCISGETTTTTSSSSSNSHLNSQLIDNSDLRKGFQPVYHLSNSFIDLLKINYPSQIFFKNDTLIKLDDFTKALADYYTSNDVMGYVKKVSDFLHAMVFFDFLRIRNFFLFIGKRNITIVICIFNYFFDNNYTFTNCWFNCMYGKNMLLPSSKLF